jgi:SNF2 family DNA or RNA helicase
MGASREVSDEDNANREATAMTDTTTTQTIQNAVRALAARCDGAATQDGMGFNGRDTSFGKSLAAIPGDFWTLKQLQAAERMLKTYRNQLAGMGFDLDGLRPADLEYEYQSAYRDAKTEFHATAPKQTRPPGRVVKNGTEVSLEFAYDGALIASLKGLGLRARKTLQGGWAWPVFADKAAAVIPLLKGFEGLEHLTGMTAEAIKNVQLSKAAEGVNVEIPGLAKGMALKPFQAAGVAYACRNKRTWIADEMGLGKSVQALATVQKLGAYPAVFVVPASLKINWLNEGKKFFPGVRYQVLDGLNAEVDPKAQGYIVNYDLLKAEKSEGPRTVLKPVGLAAKLAALNPKSLVLDESHYAKERKTARSKACKALGKLPSVEVVLLLSGTPLKNRPIELAHQLDIMGRLGEFGGFMGFARTYCNAVRGPFGWDFTGSSRLVELNDRLRASCYVRRLKAEVLPELPPLVRTIVHLPIDNMAEYARAEKSFLKWLREKKGDEAALRAAEAETLVRINALRLLACQGKMSAIKSWVETGFVEQDRKLVLFAHHIEAQDALAEEFGAQKIQGGVDREKVEAAKVAFNTGNANLIVCSLMAAGVGHNLHADGKCSSVALAELGWTPADMEQAAARVHRIGQTAESVEAYWLVGVGTIDEDMAELLAAKQAVCDMAADGKIKENLGAQSIANEVINRLLARAG